MCNYLFLLMEKNTNQPWDHQTITWASRAHWQRLQQCHTSRKQPGSSLSVSTERKQIITCTREIPEPLNCGPTRENTHGDSKQEFTIKMVNYSLCRNCFFRRKYTEIQCKWSAAACNSADTTYTAMVLSPSSIDRNNTFILCCKLLLQFQRLHHSLKLSFSLPYRKPN